MALHLVVLIEGIGGITSCIQEAIEGDAISAVRVLLVGTICGIIGRRSSHSERILGCSIIGKHTPVLLKATWINALLVLIQEAGEVVIVLHVVAVWISRTISNLVQEALVKPSCIYHLGCCYIFMSFYTAR